MAYNQSDEEVDNTYLGTPFAPLDDDQIVSRKPDLDLTVRDSKGRRRFHGAFTGGFSAGHFMTVGSEEGFTPQQFVSNREQRWDQTLIQRKPENFMDSEDLDVFGIAPKKIAAKEKFVEREFAGFRKTDSLIDVLKTVIKPTNESIGRQLYKRMKINANKEDYLQSKVYGCELSSNKSADSNLSAFYSPKSNVHGIGYKSIAEENESIQSKSSDGVSAIFKSGRKIQISGEAFGYGVLDEDIEDDAVVYHRDDMSQYDFEIGSIKSQSKTKNKNKSIDVLKSDVIEGFAKSFNKMNLIENIRHKYPIPVLPKDWRKSSVQNKPKKSRWDQKSDAQNVNAVNKTTDPNVSSKAPVLNANIRAILLGEEVIHRQGVKKPVPETKNSEFNVVLNENKSVIEKPNQQFTDKPLFGFWANKFTRSSNAFEESTLTGGLTEFKPNLKDSSVENENKQNNDENNVIKRTTYEWHPHSLLCKRFNIPNPFPHNPDFVGVVTVGRSDVRNRTSQINTKKDKPNIFDCLFNEQVLSDSSKLVSNQTNSVETNVKSTENSTEVKDINENSDEENEDPIRPPMDLFKAIFASDEESDDEDIEEDKSGSNPTVNNESNLVNNTLNDFKIPESNPNNKNRGIFANIDFDQLNRDFTPFLETNETQKSVKSDPQNREKSIEDIQNVPKISEPIDDYYGPALPPDPTLLTQNVCQNIETNSKSSKRKKKVKKQKKHKKHKTSHKKYKRHKKSSDSDSSSDEDIEHKILQHLKSARK